VTRLATEGFLLTAQDVPGRGPCLLLIHGFLSSRAQWRPNIDSLGAVCRPVVMELYGHGRSPAPKDVGCYRTERYAAAIDRIRERRAYFSDEERGYQRIQGTRPQTLGYGLNDSPVGLAAWIVEKYRTWCDCDGDPEAVFTKEELLTTVMIYWVTETATSAARYYYEGQHLPEPPYAPLTGRVEVPTGCTVFPGELGFSPRSWAESNYNIQRFTYMERGGHFAALEQPELFSDELRAFYRDLR